jgi:MSHA biogenesis protein MshJ
MEKLRYLIDKIDALSIRERGIILAAVVFIMFTLWDTFLMRPQLEDNKKLLADLQIKRAEQLALNYRIQGLSRQGHDDSGETGRNRLAELKQQLAEVETSVRNSTNHLIDADKMAAILQTILSKSRGLQLIEIKGLGVTPLLAPVAVAGQVPGQAAEVAIDDQQPADDQTPATEVESAGVDAFDNAYKHGLTITLEGDYLSALAYMRELESLEWGFFWETVEYEVTEYPRGTVAITLYTLSLGKEWIGV